MTALRVRGSLLRQMKQQVADAGGDLDDVRLDLDDVDAGVAAQVIIIVDQETVEREMARQHGHGDELEPRTPESVSKARCETLSGLPVSAATALFYAQLGSFRRMVMKPKSLDFEMSGKARLFRDSKRVGVLVRDRFCQGPGCDTSAKFCQVDHVEEYALGGLTVPANGVALCGPCNRHKEWLRLHAVH